MTTPVGPADGTAWLLLGGSAVPAAWQARARTVTLVPLLPGEEAAMLAGESPPPELAGQEPLMRLVAQGQTAKQISRELNLSPASVSRRTARLRAHFGVTTNAELASLLARRGFSG